MINWAILGTSFISGTMARAIINSPGSRLHAAFGRDDARLAAFAAQWSIPSTTTDLGSILADPAVDVVYVGLPNHRHREVVERAARAGKAVLCEKTMATSFSDATLMAEAIRKGGKLFLEGLMYLNHPVIAALVGVLRSGRLGEFRAASGFYAADIWRVANPDGGGTLFNLGCYPASLLQLVVQTLCGDEVFAKRRVAGFTQSRTPDGPMVDAVLSIAFGNGAQATLQTSDGYGFRHDFAIHGDRASLRFLTNPWLPVAGENCFEIIDADGSTETVTVTADGDAFDAQVRQVETCLADGRLEAKRPAPRLDDSLAVMALLDEWQALGRSA